MPIPAQHTGTIFINVSFLKHKPSGGFTPTVRRPLTGHPGRTGRIPGPDPRPGQTTAPARTLGYDSDPVNFHSTPALAPELKPLEPDFVDGENNPVVLDAAYALRGRVDLGESVGAILDHHGDSTLLLPMSARSGGGGIFQVRPPADGTVVGLSIEPSTSPSLRLAEDADVTTLALDDIVVCPERDRIFAGAAISLDQLNRALAELLGPGFRVLGADLTSYAYAQVGATFMTGGMGPQRRYFSDSVTAAALYDGERTRRLEGEELADHAATYGWTGIVQAVCCRYSRLPPNEVAFVLPVDSDPGFLAALLERLAPWCFLAGSDGEVVNRQGDSDMILGIEHVTLEAMEPMLAQGADNTASRRAAELAAKCRAAGCDGLVFVNGCTEGDADAFLMSLLDDGSEDCPTIAGIDLEHSEVFRDPEEMRSLREGIPFAARTQAPRGKYVFKGHTDATVRLDPEHSGDQALALWHTNREYVGSLAAYFENTPDVDGQVLVYGHMNPWGVDPHNRVTLASDDPDTFGHAVAFARERTHHFYRELDRLCRQGGAWLVGGEKGAASEREILAAFDGPSSAPDALARKFARQCRVIRAARRQFNWRALSPYGEA